MPNRKFNQHFELIYLNLIFILLTLSKNAFKQFRISSSSSIVPLDGKIDFLLISLNIIVLRFVFEIDCILFKVSSLKILKTNIPK